MDFPTPQSEFISNPRPSASAWKWFRLWGWKIHFQSLLRSSIYYWDDSHTTEFSAMNKRIREGRNVKVIVCHIYFRDKFTFWFLILSLLFSCSRQSWINEPRAESLSELGRRKVAEFANFSKVAKINLQAFCKNWRRHLLLWRRQIDRFSFQIIVEDPSLQKFSLKKEPQEIQVHSWKPFCKTKSFVYYFLLFFFLCLTNTSPTNPRQDMVKYVSGCQKHNYLICYLYYWHYCWGIKCSTAAVP